MSSKKKVFLTCLFYCLSILVIAIVASKLGFLHPVSIAVNVIFGLLTYFFTFRDFYIQQYTLRTGKEWDSKRNIKYIIGTILTGVVLYILFILLAIYVL
jgi:hypothetical protein